MDDDALANFTAITGTTPERAQQYLGLADGSLEQAIELFFANDGADLTGAGPSLPSTHPLVAAQQSPPSVPSSTQPGRPAAYESNQAASDDDFQDSDDDVQITGSGPRTEPLSRRGLRPSSRTPATATPPTAATDTLDDDEAMARRLQEEFYGSAGGGEDLDSNGVRAPIARTTETLVGPGSFDSNDEDDMRAAVMEQMRSRQSRGTRGRGKTLPF